MTEQAHRRRGLLARLHPEGIPWPMSALYNLLSSTAVFQRHYELVAEDILARCPGGQGRVLDIGTGPAWLLIALHRRCPELQLVGADISAAMVTGAKRNLAAAGCADAVQVVEAPAGRLPFPDGAFDAVVSTGSLHHWKEPVAGLDEIHRVLRSGGQALVYDLVKHTPKAVLAEAARRFGRLRMTLLWLHSFEEPFLDPPDLEKLAAATRFGSGTTRFVGVLCCLECRKA